MGSSSSGCLGLVSVSTQVNIALSMVAKEIAIFREIIIRSEKQLTFTVLSFVKGLKQVVLWTFKLDSEPCVPNFGKGPRL